MDENKRDIVDEYFKAMAHCHAIECQKVIFEPLTKKEWFFENDRWCYFEFFCEQDFYRLVATEQKDFDGSCLLRDMSYEIKMLLSFFRLRNTAFIEKSMFSDYVNKYEKAKELHTGLSAENFNLELKLKEEEALQKSDKIARRILAGCLGLIAAVLVVFGVLILSAFFAPAAHSASKYTPQFIMNFAMCRAFSESKYNIAYNSNSTYEIKGYAPDGSGKCVYVETHRWQRGTNVTTCYFSDKQIREFYNAMINPDIQGSVLVKGMPVVGRNEEVVFLKFFNDPKTCITKAIPN